MIVAKGSVNMTNSDIKHVIYDNPNMVAYITGGKEYPLLNGVMRIYDAEEGSLIELSGEGFPTNKLLGFHIINNATCDKLAEEEMYFTGVDPTCTTEECNNRNILPPIYTNNGKVYMAFYTNAFKPEDLVNKIVVINSSLVNINEKPEYRIGCGRIVPFI